MNSSRLSLKSQSKDFQSQVAVEKCTREGEEMPKSSEMQQVLDLTLASQTYLKYIRDTLVLRLNDKKFCAGHWTSQLKGLLLFHVIFRQGHPDFVRRIHRHKQLFALTTYLSASNGFELNAPINVFIQKYARFIEENVICAKRLGFDVLRKKDLKDEAESSIALRLLFRLQNLLNALLISCEDVCVDPCLDVAIVRFCYDLMMKDAKKLSKLTTYVLDKFLGRFYKLYELDAKRVVTYYQAYQAGQKYLKTIIGASKDSTLKKKIRLNISEAPLFNENIAKMEAYVLNTPLKGRSLEFVNVEEDQPENELDSEDEPDFFSPRDEDSALLTNVKSPTNPENGTETESEKAVNVSLQMS